MFQIYITISVYFKMNVNSQVMYVLLKTCSPTQFIQMRAGCGFEVKQYKIGLHKFRHIAERLVRTFKTG